MSAPVKVGKAEDLAGAVRVQITLGPIRRESFDPELSIIEVRTAEGCDKCENWDKSGQSWVIEADPAGSFCDAHLFEYYAKEDSGSIVILATGLKCSMCDWLEESQDGLEQHENFSHNEAAQALEEAMNQAAGGLASAADLMNRKKWETAAGVLNEHLEKTLEFLSTLQKTKAQGPAQGSHPMVRQKTPHGEIWFPKEGPEA